MVNLYINVHKCLNKKNTIWNKKQNEKKKHIKFWVIGENKLGGPNRVFCVFQISCGSKSLKSKQTKYAIEIS